MKPVEREAFHVYCTLVGFDLAGFDAWLPTLGECGAHRELTERRHMAWTALRSNNTDGALRHLEWMQVRWREIRAGDVLVPMAQRGKPFVDRHGRGEGPVKRLVRRVLPPLEKRLGRKATAREVWTECAHRRRTGIVFKSSDDPWKDPLQAVPTKGEPASWGRFQVIVSEVRKTLAE